MLKAVQRPNGSVISFKYDAFGRRIEKKNARATTHFVWDGNVPLHEWKTFDYRETTDNDYITWVFKDFVPVAKLQGDKSYSIISDHLGTPILAVDTQGYKVWERELDIYGKVRKLQGDKWFIPFGYQGQYFDNEVDLCYNRFRYYDCNTGSYISQDPIRLAGNNPTLYGYVFDTNTEMDIFGLELIEVNPLDINYSQRTVSEIRVFDQQKYEPIKVIDVEGQLVSYDNRRLLAAQNAGLEKLTIDLVDKTDVYTKFKMTWWEAFKLRYNDKRNIEAGGVVPDKGLQEKPKLASEICKK